jgi:hypothetical protein
VKPGAQAEPPHGRVRSPNGPLEASDRVRHLYRLDDPRHARAYLRYWCTRALRSKIPEFVFLVTRLEKHFDAITGLFAVEGVDRVGASLAG